MSGRPFEAFGRLIKAGNEPPGARAVHFVLVPELLGEQLFFRVHARGERKERRRDDRDAERRTEGERPAEAQDQDPSNFEGSSGATPSRPVRLRSPLASPPKTPRSARIGLSVPHHEIAPVRSPFFTLYRIGRNARAVTSLSMRRIARPTLRPSTPLTPPPPRRRRPGQRPCQHCQ